MAWSWRRAGALGVIVLAAHFLPPERIAPAPDDVSAAVQLRERGAAALLKAVLAAPQRPLGHALFVLRTAWTWGEPWRAMALLAGSAILATLAAYRLFRALLGNDELAYVAAILYVLLPNKVEQFHTGMHAGAHLMQALQTGAALLFVRSLRLGSRPALLGALCLFGAACLMSEGGLLLPVAVVAWAAALRLPRLRWVGWSAVPIAIVVSAYLASAGQPPVIGGLRTVRWDAIPHNVLAAPGFFIGRPAVQAAVSGLVQFPQMEAPWLALALLVNAALVCLATWWLSRTELPPVMSRMLWASAVALVALFVPYTLGVLEGRHTALPDLGFAVLLLPVVAYLRRPVAFLGAAFAILLVSAQGNGWSHVVACRINRAVAEAVQERRADVVAARVVIFDLASFAERIPSTVTLRARAQNPLSTYYGAQVFAPWGLTATVRLAGGLGAVIASQAPVRRVEDGWEYVEWAKNPRRQLAPEEGTLVIDYATVYRCGHASGNRARCAAGARPAPMDWAAGARSP